MEGIHPFLTYIFWFIILVVSTIFHEFAHGWMSYRLGDPTPKFEGRLSFNPLRHINLIGVVLFFVLVFGNSFGLSSLGMQGVGMLFAIFFAKPVLINPAYYKNPLRDKMLVALAGPLANFLLALAGMLIIFFYASLTGLPQEPLYFQDNYVLAFRFAFCGLNLTLGVFNLIPIPPLDGFSVLSYFFPSLIFSFKRYNHGFLFQFLFIILLLGPFRFIVDRYIHTASGFLFYLFYAPLSFIFY